MNVYLNKIHKSLISIIIGVLISFNVNACFAQETDYYKAKETYRKLWYTIELGGIPEYYEPDDEELSQMFDRRVGILFVFKVMGYEEDFNCMDKEEVKLILSKFKDENEIPDWARHAIAFGVKNKIICGMSADRIGIKESFTGKMFSAIALNALGYKINSEEYKRGCSILAEKGGLSIDQALELNEKKLNRAEAIEMAYALLKAKGTDNKILIERLIEERKADKEKANEFGLIEAE